VRLKTTSAAFLLFAFLTIAGLIFASRTCAYDFMKIDGPVWLDGSNYLRGQPFGMGELAQSMPLEQAIEGGDWVSGALSFWVKPDSYPPKGSAWDIVRLNWYDTVKPPMGHVCSVSLTPEGKIWVHEVWSWSRSYVGGQEPEIMSSGSIPAGMWSSVIIQWSKKLNNFSIFINGDRDTDADSYIAVAVKSPTGVVYPWVGGYGGFKGAVRDFRVWNMYMAWGNLYMQYFKMQGLKDFERAIRDDLTISCSIPTNGWTAREYRGDGKTSYALEVKNNSDDAVITIKYYGLESGLDVNEFIDEQSRAGIKSTFEFNDAPATRIDRETADHKESIYVIPCDRGYFAILYSAKREIYNCYLGVARMMVKQFDFYEKN